MKTWMWLTPFIIILIAASGWIGWTFMTATNNADQVDQENSGASVTEEGEDMSTEVINKPAPDSIVVFQDETIGYANGHDFIRQLHSFYNDTLCWGRLETADYTQQKEQAESAIKVIENAEVKNAELQQDFNSILELAETVKNSDDRDAMRNLHRFFHDLDIYFNGYSYTETFQVTEYKGES